MAKDFHYYLGPYVWDTTEPLFPHFRPPAGTAGAIDLRNLVDQGTPDSTSGVGFFAVPDSITLNSDYRLFAKGDLRAANPLESNRSIFASMLGYASVTGASLMEWLWDSITLRADPTGLTASKPLMPTVQGNLEVHLAGHSLVMSRQFDLGIPEAAKVISVMQADYRRIRDAALRGECGRGQGGVFVPDPQFHRRVLDAWGEKFKVNNPEDIFIPPDLPKETRLKHSTTITESFNTADSDTLGPDLTWSEFVGDIDVVSNIAKGNAANFNNWARADTDLAGDDHYSQVAIPDTDGSARGALARKDSTTTQTFYASYLDNPNTWATLRMSAGTSTGIGTNTTSPSWSANMPLKVECNGSTITRYVNGSSNDVATDTNITGNLRCGLFLRRAGDADVFEAADLAAGGAQMFLMNPARTDGVGHGGIFPGNRV